MDSRKFALAALALAAGCAGSGGETAVRAGSSTRSADGAKSATFDAKNEFRVTVPDGAKSVRAWFALPQELPEERIADLKIDGSLPHRIVKDDHGNSFVYVEAAAPAAKEITLAETFRITRSEVRSTVDPAQTRPLTDAERAQFAADLAPNANIQITPEIVALSKQIVGDEKNPVKAARRIYDWVLDNVDYWVKDPAHKKASPVGSAEYCLTSRTGNCTDFHSLWIALARAAGIPSRIVYGSIFKPELAGQDKDQSYHCWPMFYAPGIGWISHDVAVADIFHGPFPVDDSNRTLVHLTTASGYDGPDETKVNYYFGSLDERRVVWSIGRDLKLDPAQSAGPVNALPKAYIEVDGAPYGEKSADGKTVQWTRKLTYAEVK
jgi:hypothetical protein